MQSIWRLGTVLTWGHSLWARSRRVTAGHEVDPAPCSVNCGPWSRGWLLINHSLSPRPLKVPGEIKRSRDLRGGRWSWTFKLAQKRSWVGRWSWVAKVGLPSLRVVQVVRQQQCNGRCLSDSAQAQQLKQQLLSAQVAGQWRGDTALTLPLFWRRSTVSPVFFRRYPRRAFSLSSPIALPPPTPLSPSLISHHAFCGRKAKGSRSPPSKGH